MHTSIAGGPHMGLLRGHGLGCTTVQIFSHNPRGWRTSKITKEQAGLFSEHKEKLDISPVYIHASYLLNIASPSDELRAKSAAMLEEEMRRADVLGAEYVVLHTGSAHDGRGGNRAVGTITGVLANKSYRAGLLIENTSGKRGDIASSISEMAEIIDRSGGLIAGVCIDTCHAFAAGYDLRTKPGREGLIKEISDLIGLDTVKLIHLNDSKKGHATGLDRHEHIGMGMIGAEALGRFIRHGSIAHVPIILETPKDTEDDDPENLIRARELINPKQGISA